MNSDDDGPFNSTSFDIKILHSQTMNYHSTPPASLHRVTFDMMRTLGISERCFGVHTREPSTTTFPAYLNAIYTRPSTAYDGVYIDTSF